ncbi:unnamed protein product [Symbiodinium sp. CCMP2592]|nr:unnamed protein product [Symbiodinium sp. CCMP2592]
MAGATTVLDDTTTFYIMFVPEVVQNFRDETSIPRCRQPGATEHLSLRPTPEQAHDRYYWWRDETTPEPVGVKITMTHEGRTRFLANGSLALPVRHGVTWGRWSGPLTVGNTMSAANQLLMTVELLS